MLPMKSLRLAIGEALAAAEPLYQDTNANLVRLISAPFTPSEDLAVGDLTFADFDGSTAIACPLEEAQVGIDPNTGQQVLTVYEPAGGWRFEVTGLTNLPQTIYGFALLTAASAALIAVATLAEPVDLTAVGQEINLDKLTLTVVAQPME